jgi:hypothetical protein
LERSFRGDRGWAGVEISRDPDVVTVHYVGKVPACLAQLTAVRTSELPTVSPSSSPSRVFSTVVVGARYSLARLDALTARITQDRKALQAEGLQLSSWGHDVQRNRVVVHAVSHTQSSADLLTHRYGDAVALGKDEVGVAS